jgi:hypothetical protein
LRLHEDSDKKPPDAATAENHPALARLSIMWRIAFEASTAKEFLRYLLIYEIYEIYVFA